MAPMTVSPTTMRLSTLGYMKLVAELLAAKGMAIPDERGRVASLFAKLHGYHQDKTHPEATHAWYGLMALMHEDEPLDLHRGEISALLMALLADLEQALAAEADALGS